MLRRDLCETYIRGSLGFITFLATANLRVFFCLVMALKNTQLADGHTQHEILHLLSTRKYRSRGILGNLRKKTCSTIWKGMCWICSLDVFYVESSIPLQGTKIYISSEWSDICFPYFLPSAPYFWL